MEETHKVHPELRVLAEDRDGAVAVQHLGNMETYSAPTKHQLCNVFAEPVNIPT